MNIRALRAGTVRIVKSANGLRDELLGVASILCNSADSSEDMVPITVNKRFDEAWDVVRIRTLILCDRRFRVRSRSWNLNRTAGELHFRLAGKSLNDVIDGECTSACKGTESFMGRVHALCMSGCCRLRGRNGCTVRRLMEYGSAERYPAASGGSAGRGTEAMKASGRSRSRSGRSRS